MKDKLLLWPLLFDGQLKPDARRKNLRNGYGRGYGNVNGNGYGYGNGYGN